jgi:hypothetical protein
MKLKRRERVTHEATNKMEKGPKIFELKTWRIRINLLDEENILKSIQKLAKRYGNILDKYPGIYIGRVGCHVVMETI